MWLVYLDRLSASALTPPTGAKGLPMRRDDDTRSAPSWRCAASLEQADYPARCAEYSKRYWGPTWSGGGNVQRIASGLQLAFPELHMGGFFNTSPRREVRHHCWRRLHSGNCGNSDAIAKKGKRRERALTGPGQSQQPQVDRYSWFFVCAVSAPARKSGYGRET